jgi:hypothetical protein
VAADYLPVRSHRPLRYLAGRRPCGGHITEGLAQTLLPRPIRNYRRVQILFRGIRPAGRRPSPRHPAAQPHKPKREATTQARSEYPDLGLFLRQACGSQLMRYFS